ncbi:MAG: O-antigen ligase family protein [Parcubacteria group bacterium]|nr:O-antigen ligase family protein [Parcubacteria group bacterium]
MKFLDIVIRAGTLLFVFLIPWQARLIIAEGSINGQYWEYGTQSLYATEVLLFVVLIAVVAKGAASVLARKPGFSMRRLAPPAGAFVVFLAWAGVSILWSVDRGVALEHWLALVSGVAVFLILASGAASFSRLSWAIIISGSIQAILAFVQFRLQEVGGSTWLGMAFQHASVLGTSVVETDMMRMLRAYGSFPHPNILGGWLVLGLLLAVKETAWRGRRGAFAPLAYVAVAVLSTGLAVTFSRSAWLAFGVGFAVYVLIALIRLPRSLRSLAMTFVVIVLFAGTLIISYPEPFKERVFGGGRLEVKSYEERSSGISEAWQLIKQHPIAGVGIGNYGLAVHRDIDASQPAYYYQPVHAVPLLVMAELGIIGLIFVLGFLYFVLSSRHPGRSEPAASGVEGSRWLSAGVFLLPLAILALFDHYLWSLYSGMMIGVVYLAIFYLKLAKI